MIYLYVKQHSKTGLKYFGKTIRDPYSYLGSGSYWKNHIKKHGLDFVKTLEVWEFEDQEQATNFALQFSERNNIVESEKWANQIIETATDRYTSGYSHSERTRQIISEKNKVSMKGEKNPFYGKTHSEETRKKLSDKNKQFYENGGQNHFLGKTHSEEARKRMSIAKTESDFFRCNRGKGDYIKGDKNPFYGKTHSEETRAKWSAIRSRKRWIHKEENSTLVDIDLISEYLNSGWLPGRGNLNKDKLG